jgi:MFS family permease
MLVLGFPLGFFLSGNFSGVGAFLTELYPSRVRGSGQGFTYNFGRAIGASFPTLVGFMSARMHLGTAIGLFAGVAFLLVILAVSLLPETRGKHLAVYD